jgi:SAM-dependent methyltransferase
MTAKTAGYTGVDVLEALAAAKNYNACLVRQTRRFLDSEKRILDLGAGVGTFSKLFRSAGYDVTCIEPDPGMAELLKKEKFEVMADISEVPDESLPAIYTFNVLEHVKDDSELIQQIYRKLEPGGKLIIYVPAMRLLWSSFDDKVCHFRRYGKKELAQKLQKAGFLNSRLSYADSLGVLAGLLYRYFMDKGDGFVSPRAITFYDRYLFPLSQTGDILGRFLAGKNLWAFAQKAMLSE